MYLATMPHYSMPNGHIMKVILNGFNRKKVHDIWSVHGYPSRELIKHTVSIINEISYLNDIDVHNLTLSNIFQPFKVLQRNNSICC